MFLFEHPPYIYTIVFYVLEVFIISMYNSYISYYSSQNKYLLKLPHIFLGYSKTIVIFLIINLIYSHNIVWAFCCNKVSYIHNIAKRNLKNKISLLICLYRKCIMFSRVVTTIWFLSEKTLNFMNNQVIF